MDLKKLKEKKINEVMEATSRIALLHMDHTGEGEIDSRLITLIQSGIMMGMSIAGLSNRYVNEIMDEARKEMRSLNERFEKAQKSDEDAKKASQKIMNSFNGRGSNIPEGYGDDGFIK